MIFTHNKTSPLLAPSVSDKKIIMLISNYGISFCCISEVLWQAFHRHGPTSKRLPVLVSECILILKKQMLKEPPVSVIVAS